MGLIWEIVKALTNSSSDRKSENQKNLEKECDYNKLDFEEREQVMKGNQDPWDFEWDGEEETDYYKDYEK